jgi:hypothetical protein
MNVEESQRQVNDPDLIPKEVKIKTDIQSALVLLESLKKYQADYHVTVFPQLLLDYMINQEMASIKMDLETKLLRSGHKSKDAVHLRFSVPQIMLMINALEFEEMQYKIAKSLLEAFINVAKRYSHLLIKGESNT